MSQMSEVHQAEYDAIQQNSDWIIQNMNTNNQIIIWMIAILVCVGLYSIWAYWRANHSKSEPNVVAT